jgi:hypothetical protein
MSDNHQQNPNNNHQQYGYVPIGPNDRPRIRHQSSYRSSIFRGEVFSQLGRAKQERTRLQRIIREETAIADVLLTELEDIGTLVFNDLLEERVALGKIRNMICTHVDILENKLQSVLEEIEALHEFWHDWLRRGMDAPISQYN